jgi:hypothetical protein
MTKKETHKWIYENFDLVRVNTIPTYINLIPKTEIGEYLDEVFKMSAKNEMFLRENSVVNMVTTDALVDFLVKFHNADRLDIKSVLTDIYNKETEK